MDVALNLKPRDPQKTGVSKAGPKAEAPKPK
jgi:hypothetical protein